jgi:ribosomal protein L35
MKKAVAKRIRITKKGKIMRRTMGQSHFFAKKRTTVKKRKKVSRGLGLGIKVVKDYSYN